MRRFEACQLRIKRAMDHGKTLSDLWSKIPEKDFYTPVAKVKPNGEGAIFFNQVNPLPPEFSLQFGEMFYQLRAALDGAIYQANVFQAGQDPPPNESDFQFPIFGKRRDYCKNSPRMIGPLSDECEGVIEAVQPYNVPELIPSEQVVTHKGRCLDILNDWARIDRHRRLYIVGASATTSGPLIDCPEGVILESLTLLESKFLKEENVIATFKLSGYSVGKKVNLNPQLRADIAINEAPPQCAPNDTFAQRLTAIASTVVDIVHDLELAF